VPLIPPETVEQIIAANDIVEVVSGYFPLKRRGAQYWATCPFHQERSASFSVNSQRQIFKCFGCGAGGSVIRFVMNYENLDFVTAAKKLAERAGIKLVEAEMSAEDTARFTMRRRLLALHAEAAEFFHQQLMKKPSAQVARDYLKGRGIGGEVARNWKLGYAPDGWDAMRDFGQAQGFSDEELIASGLVKLRDEEQPRGEFYDRFRGRMMIPICDDTGNVIAFSGRVLTAEAQAAKYVNSPETMLFKKGEMLFGLYKSKRAILKTGSAVVIEGQIDLITAFEAGIENVVATQGTAFTERQTRKIKQCFADGIGEVVQCFDADAAGVKGMERSLAALLFANISVRVAEMPPGEDPDSMIRGKGAAAFRERIDDAKDFFDFQLDRIVASEDFTTPRGKMQAAQKMAGSIGLISDAILRETQMYKATTRLEISMAEFTRLVKLRTAKPLEDEPAPLEPDELVESPVTLEPTIDFLARVALHDAPAREWLLDEPWDRVLAEDPGAELLVKILAADIQPGQPTSVHAFLTTLSAVEEAYVTKLLDEPPPANAMIIAHDSWRDLEKRKIQLRQEAIKARMRSPELDPTEVAKLQKEVFDLKKRLSDIARPLSPPL
jgi:DNA primase